MRKLGEFQNEGMMCPFLTNYSVYPRPWEADSWGSVVAVLGGSVSSSSHYDIASGIWTSITAYPAQEPFLDE